MFHRRRSQTGQYISALTVWFDITLFVINFIFVAAILVAVSNAVPASFSMGINWFALVPAVSAIANLTLIVVLARRPNEGQAMLWFALFIIFNALWGTFETAQRLTNSPAGNAFWSHINFGLLSFLPVFFYLFIRSYTDRSRLSDSWRTPAVFIAGAMIISGLVAGDGVFPTPLLSERLAWGYEAPTTLVSYLFVAWSLLVTLAAAGRLGVLYRMSTSTKDRRQALLLGANAILLVTLESLSAVILPGLGFRGVIPSLGVVVNTIMAITVIMSIRKYGAFSINVGELADSVLGTMAEAVFVTNQHDRVVYANTAADLLLGDKKTLIIGRNLRDLAKGQLDREDKSWRQEVALNHRAELNAVNIPTQAGQRVVNVHVSEATRSDWGYVFVLSDVTLLSQANAKLQQSRDELTASLSKAKILEDQLRDEKASVERRVVRATAGVQAEHAKLLASINSLNIGFVMTDARGQIVMANTATQLQLSKGLGLKGSQLNVEPNILTGVLDQYFGLIAKINKCLESAHPQTFHNLQFQERIMNITLQPVMTSENKVLGVVVLLDDVTDLANLERSRDEFFSIASHELRTPLTAIRGNTTMIQQYYGDKIRDPDVKSMLGDIHDSSVRLIAIVNDFLDMSRLEQGRIRFKLESVDVVALCRTAVDQSQSAIDSQSVPVKILANPKHVSLVWADYDRLTQVITNLIGNALKFTDKGQILIGFAQVDSKVIITVKDSGRGIAPEAKHLLFRKFQQASDDILTRDSTRSTGLGLYISKNLMKAMNGDLELIESTLGSGSTFAITVPIPQK